MSGMTDLPAMLAHLEPELRPDEYVYVVVATDVARTLPSAASIVEAEGVTVVLRRDDAIDAGLAYDTVLRWITLRVHSSLEAVGLTAAFATALGDAGISCNVLAAFHHDHILVPATRAAEAMDALRALSQK